MPGQRMAALRLAMPPNAVNSNGSFESLSSFYGVSYDHTQPAVIPGCFLPAEEVCFRSGSLRSTGTGFSRSAFATDFSQRFSGRYSFDSLSLLAAWSLGYLDTPSFAGKKGVFT